MKYPFSIWCVTVTREHKNLCHPLRGISYIASRPLTEKNGPKTPPLLILPLHDNNQSATSTRLMLYTLWFERNTPVWLCWNQVTDTSLIFLYANTKEMSQAPYVVCPR
jgi:hypothetical protein